MSALVRGKTIAGIKRPSQYSGHRENPLQWSEGKTFLQVWSRKTPAVARGEKPLRYEEENAVQ
jgi:hypothetical protein